MVCESAHMFRILQGRLSDRELEVAQSARSKLEQLGALWAQYGAVMNLTARLDGGAIAAHVHEAIAVAVLARRLGVGGPGATWLDVGSGGGFPGLVLAAVLAAEFTLVEPRQRRATFLELALTQIGRPDCSVHRARVSEDRWQPISGSDSGRRPEPRSFSCAGSRATFAPARWLAVASAWVEPGGAIFAHLGAGDEDPDGWAALDREDRGPWSIRAFRVPG